MKRALPKDPCPCGQGKKYSQCCMRRQPPAQVRFSFLPASYRFEGSSVAAVACVFQSTGDCYVLLAKLLDADDDFAAGQEAARDVDRILAQKQIPPDDFAVAAELRNFGYIPMDPGDFREVFLLNDFMSERKEGLAMPAALATLQVQQELERRDPAFVYLTFERLVGLGHSEANAMQKIVKARVFENWAAVHQRRQHSPDLYAALLEGMHAGGPIPKKHL